MTMKMTPIKKDSEAMSVMFYSVDVTGEEFRSNDRYRRVQFFVGAKSALDAELVVLETGWFNTDHPAYLMGVERITDAVFIKEMKSEKAGPKGRGCKGIRLAGYITEEELNEYELAGVWETGRRSGIKQRRK